MEKVSRVLRVLIIVVLLAFGATWFYENHWDNTSDDKTVTSGSVKSASAEQDYSIDESVLNSSVQSLLDQNSDLDTSVSITDLQTGKTYHYGETASYTAASIGKLVTATAFLHKVEAGQVSMDDDIGGSTARNQLTQMITVSDNDAWEALNENVTHDGLKAYATSIGMTTYDPTDNNMTSDDIALLLTKLSSQKLLNTEDTAFLLSLMKQANMRDYIVAAIPDGTDVYHKVGYLSDRLHDASIIKRGDRSYVLVIFSKSMTGSYDFTRGSTFFGEITKATLSSFFK
jgi:beta-lactamase class A